MRLAALSSDTMTPEQVGLYREILSGPRGQGPRAVLLATGAGGLAGPFNAMLYAPDVGHALQELDPEIQALRAGTDPGFADEQERVAYQVVRSLVGPADLDDHAYDLAVRALGERALVELSTLVGYYATLALQLRIFRVGSE
jgi:4-carboxymuconolactone decarboxylase